MNFKKKINIIVIVVLSFLCFNTNVYAAQKLTCVYNKSGETLEKAKVVLTQDAKGNIKVYKNDEDADLNGKVSGKDEQSYWNEMPSPYFKLDKSKKNGVSLDKNGNLKECPKSKTTSSNPLKYSTSSYGGLVTFYGNNKGKAQLNSKSNSVKTVQTKSSGTGTTEFDTTSNGSKTCSEIPDSDKWLAEHKGYTLACLYERQTTANPTYGKCHIVQINIAGGGVKTYDSDQNYDSKLINFDSTTDITESDFSKANGGECPATIKVRRSISTATDANGTVLGDQINTSISLSSSKGEAYTLVDADGKNTVTGEQASSEFSFDIKFQEVKIDSCDDIFKDSEDLKETIKSLITVVKIVVPIILIVLGSLDFAKGIFASDESGIKAAQSKFVKRLLIAVVIFLIPTVLKAILTIANSIWPVIDADLCGLI